eukprot:TRINITY_DN29333_c0_g2_i1.p1 TRINITY_DN29333_c0_g2~~TRINITY_DN29333_c0_g2_i1.p1  ORF type:complete len:577 (-),score=100.33 TRINITY_DN29333_c0_g2_i1:248-1978(-)
MAAAPVSANTESDMGPSILRGLPGHLAERLRVAKPGVIASGNSQSNGLVLYWMRGGIALRAHENPALDLAILAANQLRAALLVLLHVEDQYPQATARRQAFLLEGARAVRPELEARGAFVQVQIDREGCRPALQERLAAHASVMITEEPFCVPWMAGVERLLKQPFKSPLWLVDCSSVVPSALVPPRACWRAYTYEDATKALHAERVPKPWCDMRLESPIALDPSKLGLPESTNLEKADFAMLLSQMGVDKNVQPVHHTQGGSQHGYARWAEWLSAGGLKTYAKRRNDAHDTHGVSRMSAYLNTGMVSPMRIAREASAASGAGKSKFLQEFLVWRGVSYAYCFHFPMPASGATLAQLPSWAQETLLKHASDARRTIPYHALAAGRSGDRGWDSMQRYLVESGELHNNARMGWGKALAAWTSSPKDALETLVDLNNRFALDGHAPPSYGGLLGCLGLFEGPKAESKITGKVSYKPPKAKYATLSARSLENCARPLTPRRMEAGAGVQSHVQAPLEQQPLRRWLKATPDGDRGGIDTPTCDGASNSTDMPCSKVKRRWVLKGSGASDGVVTVDLSMDD